ncbi:hypothetical protein XENORESO_009488 [Xenotaenia resolanae]|uniref:2-amino-3-carboxymuconate-6-semialdehyde decarboxylase n=1 Tax=Xenotaenia resolanae TaxID=208358 RepID=A0ABV0X7P5_9TELE
MAICSMIFGGIFERFPKLKVCFAHGGGSFPFTVGRIEHGHKVRPDLCAVDNSISPRKYLSSFYTDSLVHDPISMRLLVDVIGKAANLVQDMGQRLNVYPLNELIEEQTGG